MSGVDDKQIMLFIESERYKTFKEWPNDLSWFCTPEKLAKAGFYFNPGPESLDNACCVFCQKELDGWEPDDDPVQEHKKHSPKCPFLALQKPVEDLTVTEFLKLIMKTTIFRTEKMFDTKKREYEEQAATSREAIVQHIGST